MQDPATFASLPFTATEGHVDFLRLDGSARSRVVFHDLKSLMAWGRFIFLVAGGMTAGVVAVATAAVGAWVPGTITLDLGRRVGADRRRRLGAIRRRLPGLSLAPGRDASANRRQTRQRGLVRG